LSVSSIRAWLGHGRRRLYATGVTAAVLLVAGLSTLPAGGGVSSGRMQELLNASYNTSGTRCVPSAHGRQTCQLSAGKCSGTLIVAAVGASNFTIVDATPERLDSATCNRGEDVEGEVE
jgi:hypothetical protein